MKTKSKNGWKKCKGTIWNPAIGTVRDAEEKSRKHYFKKNTTFILHPNLKDRKEKTQGHLNHAKMWTPPSTKHEVGTFRETRGETTNNNLTPVEKTTREDHKERTSTVN